MAAIKHPQLPQASAATAASNAAGTPAAQSQHLPVSTHHLLRSAMMTGLLTYVIRTMFAALRCSVPDVFQLLPTAPAGYQSACFFYLPQSLPAMQSVHDPHHSAALTELVALQLPKLACCPLAHMPQVFKAFLSPSCRTLLPAPHCWQETLMRAIALAIATEQALALTQLKYDETKPEEGTCHISCIAHPLVICIFANAYHCCCRYNHCPGVSTTKPLLWCPKYGRTMQLP